MESSPFGNPEFTELESGIEDPESGIWNPQCGIHSVESRIQDCHGFPYMGRLLHGILVTLFDVIMSRSQLSRFLFVHEYLLNRLNKVILR